MPEDDLSIFAREVLSLYLGKEVIQLTCERLSGGCINEAFKIETEAGSFFLKRNEAQFEIQFRKEAKALEILRDSHTLKVPEVFRFGTHNHQAYLLTEFIHPGVPDRGFWQGFGEGLAKLHRITSENHRFGLSFNNFIGELPQVNDFKKNWIDFFIENRLEAQAKQALKNQLITPDFLKKFRKLYEQLPVLLPREPPSLIHGDLWSGNFLSDSQGKAVLIDPAIYYGNREIELAFTHLFGGFSPAFYESYQDVWPLQPGFEERIDIYNLYPLLVHVNLFGSSYLLGIKNVIRRYT